MRIVHFDSDSLGTPYAGGQARRAHEINKRLATRHDVTVITAGFRGLHNETIDGVRYQRMIPLSHPANFVAYFIELVPRAWLSPADLIVEDFSSPLTASGLPALVHRPVVGVASYLFGKHAAQRYHLPIDRWEALTIGRYRYLIALTGTQNSQLRAYAKGAQIRVISNGADDEAFAHPWLGDQTYIAFLGRLDSNMKGLDLLLDAACELPPGLPLAIAGGGPGEKWLSDQIKVRGLNSRAYMLGRLDGAQRHSFLAHAKAMAFPSRYENQSLVGLDALAIGVPIVAFDVDSSRELFGDCAILIAPFDTQSFGRALVHLAADSVRARELSVLARAKGGEFTWDRAAAEQESFYSEILDSTSSGRRR